MVRGHPSNAIHQRPVRPLQIASVSTSAFPHLATAVHCRWLIAFVFAWAFAGLQNAWANTTSSAENSTSLRSVHLPLRQLIGGPLTLRGAESERRIHLGVRLDEMVIRGRLKLAITPSPALLPALSHLQIRLNDKLLSVVPIRADTAASGERIVREIDLDPRLFVDDNWLSLRMVGHYTLECEDPLHSSLWVEVDVDTTAIDLDIRPLTLEDELALFPVPWFDRRSAGRIEVPMVLGEQPNRERLITASIMASWLGSLAGERTAVFPVLRDRLPDQHAVVLVNDQLGGPEGLLLPAAQGPTVRLMRNPAKPHLKLLVLHGRNEQELRTAALGLMLGRQAISGSSALIHEVAPIPIRPAYDAPNWVTTTRPVRLGEIVPERGALQLTGTHPDAVRVRWRTPPDLWQGPGRNALLDLRYRVSVASETENALMGLVLNETFVRAWRLGPSPSNNSFAGWLNGIGETSGSVLVKLPEFQPQQTNTLEVRLPLGMKPQAGNCAGRAEATRASVDAESTLDFSALPHFLEMPDLAAFAGSGFPFTRHADLSQTAIVMSGKPDQHEIETLLALMGSFGRWTGTPAWHVDITTPDALERVADRDLLLIGGEQVHDLLGRLQKNPMLLMASAHRQTSGPPTLVAEWRGWLRARAEMFSANASTPQAALRLDATGPLAMMTGFESPLHAGRSIVALSGNETQALRWLSMALLEPALATQIQGGLALIREREVRAYESPTRYHIGHLPLLERVTLFVTRYPWIGAVALALALSMLVWIARHRLRLRATRRLKISKADP